MTRGALQRLDAGDVVSHGFEDHEPAATPATDGVGSFDSTTADGVAAAIPALVGGAPLVLRDVTVSLVGSASASSRPLARAVQPARSRAPPVR